MLVRVVPSTGEWGEFKQGEIHACVVDVLTLLCVDTDSEAYLTGFTSWTSSLGGFDEVLVSAKDASIALLNTERGVDVRAFSELGHRAVEFVTLPLTPIHVEAEAARGPLRMLLCSETGPFL